ncbi:MAG: hypothetical protein WB586_13430 [Chthoniobacterales bacterium]
MSHTTIALQLAISKLILRIDRDAISTMRGIRIAFAAIRSR